VDGGFAAELLVVRKYRLLAADVAAGALVLSS